MVNRYKVIWQEWVSPNNPGKVISSETSFKTRTQAEEFFEAFKDTVKRDETYRYSYR